MKTILDIRSLTLPLIFTTLLFCGCSEPSLTFLLQFDDVAGLKQDSHVYFGQNDIGQVRKVTYTTAGDYLVEVTILPEFKNAATVDSRFYIEPFGSKQTLAVIVEQDHPGGTVLNNGVTVTGSKRTGYLDTIFKSIRDKAGEAGIELDKNLDTLQKSLEETSTKLNTSLGEAISDLVLQFDSFRSDIESIPDSQEVKQIEESIRQFTDEFAKAQKDVQDHIRNDLLPQLRQELETLRRQLDETGRKEEREEIDREVQKLETI